MPTLVPALHAAVILAAGSSPSSKSSSSPLPFIILILLFVVAYMVFIRPARNRQRAQVAARRQVSVGDEVTTTAGLIATVVAVDDDYVTLEVAPGVHSRYLPAAVLRVNTDDEAEEGPDVTNHEVIDDPEAGGHTDGDAPGPAEEPGTP